MGTTGFHTPVKSVVASWYGETFDGRRTASGVPFDRFGDTVASRTLRLNSTVLLINPVNHKEVKVTVTDRGPFVPGRDLDVSEGVAIKLGFRDKGVTKLLLIKTQQVRKHTLKEKQPEVAQLHVF